MKVLKLGVIVALFMGISNLVFADNSREVGAKIPNLLARLNELKAVKNEPLTFEIIDIIDSRCPKGVNCFWEGNVMTTVAVTSAGMTEELTISSPSAKPVQFGSYTIELVSVPKEIPVNENSQLGYLIIKRVDTSSCHHVLQRFCTMEYRPTICLFSGKEFIGANPCQAQLNAEFHACLNGYPFNRAELNCYPHSGE